MNAFRVSYSVQHNEYLKLSFICGILLCCIQGISAPQVLVEYFFQTDCTECHRVETFVIPRLEEEFPKKIKLCRYDIGETENYLRLAQYQDQFRNDNNESVCIVINRRIYLCGYDRIQNSLFNEIKQLLAQPTENIPDAVVVSRDEILRKRAEHLTLTAILLAGLIDGINPCVFTTLIFFLSLLAVSKVSGNRLLAVGFTYCLACFLSYLALGFGLFRFLKLFSGYQVLQNFLDSFLLVLLLLFAFLSFHDGWRFWRTQSSGSVVIQLPNSIKMRIHSFLRQGLQYRFLIPGIFCVGVLVTVLESICTGQVYLPTLVILSKEYGTSNRWFGYLLLYNVMFIVPLLILFGTTYFGISKSRMLQWSKIHIVIGKILLGFFFLLLALFLIWLKIRGKYI